MNNLITWCYINAEILDLQSRFEAAFDAEELIRDYDQDWEWLYGYSNLNNGMVNISRQHKMNKSMYDKPLRIRIETVNEITDALLFQTVKVIHDAFKTTVYQGVIKDRGIDLSDYLMEAQYKYEI